MAMPERRLRVGVSLRTRADGAPAWDDSVARTSAFVAQLLNGSPAVAEAMLVANGGSEDSQGHVASGFVARDGVASGIGVRIVGPDEAQQTLDVAIEPGVHPSHDWARAVRSRGGRIVNMRVANACIAAIEHATFGKPQDDSAYVGAGTCDAVWTVAQHERASRDYLSLTLRAPVLSVPALWTPFFADRGFSSLPPELQHGYAPGHARWRAWVLETNASVESACLLPVLACEEAYRRQPAFLDRVMVLNAQRMQESFGFRHFSRSLDIVNRGLITFTGPIATAEATASTGECIVSHAWESGPCEFHYEALSGGYPLVHNVPQLKGCGYGYTDFDSDAAGRILLEAFARHDENLPAYCERASDFLRRLDVAYPANVEAYTRAVLALFEPAELRGTR
ncbi:MAG TPA: DUF2827 family protein [Ramlibacter sp.]|uniref:DUF2827 family protein n=1 Tax=Ramlibacter sp. TaxID=1917967 RepID=UPI002BB16850|nr:DUF2827 family protein [Ramlibacter sp.]HVZ43399.1 DUF2827 family protein [Ramlibacter sp.]